MLNITSHAVMQNFVASVTNKHYFGQPIISLNNKVDAISWVESDHVWAVRPSVSKIRLGRVGFGPKS